MKFTNLSGNLGNDLIKAIYSEAYKLEANEIIVNVSKYNKWADIALFEGNDCICWHIIVSL